MFLARPLWGACLLISYHFLFQWGTGQIIFQCGNSRVWAESCIEWEVHDTMNFPFFPILKDLCSVHISLAFTLRAILCLSQYCVHHLSPCISNSGLYGWQDGEECDLGVNCCRRHAHRSHDAGLHLLEPMDRHGNAPGNVLFCTFITAVGWIELRNCTVSKSEYVHWDCLG